MLQSDCQGNQAECLGMPNKFGVSRFGVPEAARQVQRMGGMSIGVPLLRCGVHALQGAGDGKDKVAVVAIS